MADNTDFSRLFRRSLVATAVCAALVTICYFVVDRPVASFVYAHRIANHPELKELTYPPPIAQAWAPAVLVLLMIRRARGPFKLWERTLLAACVAMIVADQFRLSLAVVFGRYWPETWINNNPSFIQNGAYGFHWFHEGTAYASFPSGHMARTVAAATAFWIAFPRWRWLSAAAPAAIAIGLLGMNYHFTGDVIGGSFVGGIVGAFTAYFCGVRPVETIAGDS